jgi:multiple sugar transport system permease protein
VVASGKSVAERGSGTLAGQRLLYRPDRRDSIWGRILEVRPKRGSVTSWAFFGILVVVTIIFLFPFYWIVSSSLQTTREASSLPLTWWPAHPQWHNFVVAWDAEPFTRYLLNTLFVVVLATIGEVTSAAACAYGFARIKFPGRDFWFIGVLASIMLPGSVTLIPLFIIFKDLGWINTLYPLWVPAFLGGGAYNIFLLRQFMLAIPQELEDAAIVDGASRVKIFLRVVMPLVKPALVVCTWQSVLSAWGNFFLPLIILTSTNKWTLAVALYEFPGLQPSGWADQLVMAIALLMMLPIIIGFFIVQRWLIEGVNLTGASR